MGDAPGKGNNKGSEDGSDDGDEKKSVKNGKDGKGEKEEDLLPLAKEPLNNGLKTPGKEGDVGDVGEDEKEIQLMIDGEDDSPQKQIGKKKKD